MRKDSIQTAVAGVSGYAGLELARLLLHHPALKGRPPVFVGRDAEPVRLTDMHPQLADNNGSSGLLVEPFSWELLKERGVDLLFLATPHEQSRSWVPEALAHGLRVVDLSGAWRLRAHEHRAIYGFHDAGRGAGRANPEQERLWFAGVASRVHSQRAAGGQPRMLRHLDHPGVEAAGGRRLGRSRSRHHLRFEVGRLRRGQSAHRHHPLHVCRGQSLRLCGLWPPAHGRDAGAAEPGGVADHVYPAPVADSAGHSLHHLRDLSGEEGGRRGGRMLP